MKRSAPRKRGRPPAGAEWRESLKLPALDSASLYCVMAELKAWGLITHRPIWRLVEDAVSQALDNEPTEVRELVRKVAQRRQSSSTDK